MNNSLEIAVAHSLTSFQPPVMLPAIPSPLEHTLWFFWPQIMLSSTLIYWAVYFFSLEHKLQEGRRIISPVHCFNSGTHSPLHTRLVQWTNKRMNEWMNKWIHLSMNFLNHRIHMLIEVKGNLDFFQFKALWISTCGSCLGPHRCVVEPDPRLIVQCYFHFNMQIPTT